MTASPGCPCVYELARVEEQFVLFMSVLYHHLRRPLLALDVVA